MHGKDLDIEAGPDLRPGLTADSGVFARRTALLRQVTAALTRAATVRDVAEVVTSHGHALFGASASLLYLIDGETLELVAFGGVPTARVEPWRQVALAGPDALARAIRDGEPLWLGGRDVLLATCPELADVADADVPLTGLVALPLRDTAATIGGLAFSFYAAVDLDAVERDLFLTVASQCGLALERARAYDAERRARAELERQQRRLELLARAGEDMAASLDSRRALVGLARLVVPQLADWCAIDELGEDGQIRRLTVEHRDPARAELAIRLHERYPPRPGDAHGVPRVLRTGETEFVPDIPDAILVAGAHDDEHLTLARSLGLRSFAVVPLTARGRVLGALSLVTDGERRLDRDDVRIAEELGRRAALALDNARLYEAAEAARGDLHGLFMTAPAAVALCRGPALQVELANDVFRRHFVGAEGPPPAVGAAIDRVAATGESAVLPELAVADPSGTTRLFHVVCQATRGPGDAAAGVMIFAFDISQQVQARREALALAAEVARSEARMRALVDATAVIVWTATATGEVVEPSPSWLEFTGQTVTEYSDGGFLDAIHPDDRAPTMAVWTRASAAGAPYAAEYRLRRKDGGWAHTLARGMPVRDEGGAVREYIGCNVDVTELRRTETAAREHADTLAILNDIGRMITGELDLQKLVQAVTDAATTLTGAQFGAFFYNVLAEDGGRYMLYTLSGVAREHFSKFPMPRATAVFAPTFRGEGVIRSDDITQDPRYGQSAPYHGMPAGHLPVRSYLAVPVTARSGEVLGGIFLGHAEPGVFSGRAEPLVVGLAAQAAVAMDNARLYSEAQRLIKALEATNRELDQFAYVTSHDLKAPLRGITGLAEWIEEDLGDAVTDGVRRNLELLRGRARRMEALIQGILEFSRAGRLPGKHALVDVARLVKDVVELLAPTAPASVTIDGSLPEVVTERVGLQQVFLNLISNALKHARRPDAAVRVACADDGEHWRFCVADNGPGIAPAYRERVWGIFQTLEARDKVEGTGIGLAIVKKIVEGRGGRVWIDGGETGGAAFFFTWPKREDRRP